MSLPINSRMKGKRGELDAAAHLTALTGLAKLHTATATHPLVVTRDGLHLCELSRLRVQLLRLAPPDVILSVHNTTAAFMRQAVDDASGVPALVLMRQDRHPWLAVWRSQDEDRIAYQLDQVWNET